MSVACTISIANNIQYEAILNTFRTAKSISTRRDALISLGSAHSPELITRTLNLANSAEVQTRNDQRYVFMALRKHAGGVRQLWGWLKQNYEDLLDGTPGIMTGTVVEICVGGFTTWNQLKVVEAFFKGKDTSVRSFTHWNESGRANAR
jgi:hypothetical protein